MLSRISNYGLVEAGKEILTMNGYLPVHSSCPGTDGWEWVHPIFQFQSLEEQYILDLLEWAEEEETA